MVIPSCNLLPVLAQQELTYNEKKNKANRLLALFIACLILKLTISIGAYGYSYFYPKSSDSLVDLQTQSQIYLTKDKELTTKIEMLNGIASEKKAIIPIIDKIAVTKPDGVFFENIKFSANKITIIGFSANPDLVSSFMQNLRTIDTFADIKNTREQKNSLEGFTFDISLK